MFVKKALVMLGTSLLVLPYAAPAVAQTAPYPPSPVITEITFDMTTLQELADGSDNWVITWADDGHQYTSWGDGGGFGSSGSGGDDRVSLGVGRVEGPKDNYTGFNVWGGKNHEAPSQFSGKSVGLISIDGTLYMWRNGDSSTNSAFEQTELYKSTNHAKTFQFTGVRYTPDDFPNSKGIFSPTFLQFGQDYQGARDNYVYTFAPETMDETNWEVQKPGEILLMRVPKQEIEDQSKYEYFAGLQGQTPTWTNDITDRAPVFVDVQNGVMRTSVIYNAGLDRYLLITQQVSRKQTTNYHIGIYDAPEPWGPWTTVFFGNPKNDIPGSLNTGSKTVFWNFSSKWMSADGKQFVMVYTGDGSDNWGSVEGHFSTDEIPTDPPPTPTGLQVE